MQNDKKVSFLLDRTLFDIMWGLARDRGENNVSGVMREAVSEYVKREKNPDDFKTQFRQALEEDPGLVAEVAEAVHNYEIGKHRKR